MEELMEQLDREIESILRKYPIEVVDAWRDSRRNKTKKKVIRIKVTKKMQQEINKVRIMCGFDPEPIKEDYELESLFG